ncbi:MAG: T9SS type A sorting domain-containing protein [Candidatus Cloacimonetes bacterium]|nr:T9SS type A sorting domain-containing protein [Candidatus Cloacimonadota bacterium]
MEEYPDAPNFIPLIWQGDSSYISPYYSQRAALYGVGGIPHAQWGGTYEIVGGGGSTMFAQYRTRYNAMVSWESPLEIELVLDPSYETVSAEITVTGEISTTNNKVIFIVTNHQNDEYFCSVITYDEYNFNLTEPGTSETFTHMINPGSYNIDNLTINVLVQTLSGTHQILQAGRVIVAEETVPLHVEAISFEPVAVGESYIQTLPVYNYSDTALTGMLFPPQCFITPSDFSIPAHTIGEVEIEFAPQQAIVYEDILIVTTSHPDFPNFFINLTGEGLPGSSNNENQVTGILEFKESYPNPFNPETTLSYNLAAAGKVELKIYNLKGELVAELVNTYQEAGAYQVVWSAAGLSSGMYLARLHSGNQAAEQKLILLK